MKFKKIDAIIIVVLIVISTLFLYKADYINPPSPDNDTTPPDIINQTVPPVMIPTPPTSLIPAYRRDVSPEDEGVHFDQVRISREWWYFNAVFNDNTSELRDWTVAVSFNHMARGDLFGTNKPDLLVVSLLGSNTETYGGMINKQHYLGILNDGTLIANSPGVQVSFDNSWAEGSYPRWHVHAEDQDIEAAHEIVIDLDYFAQTLPVWTLGTRAFDKSESELATYVVLGCSVSGTVTIDGMVYTVKGTGTHEHCWTPNVLTRGSINGWDWFSLSFDNGWKMYATNYLPTPQALSGGVSKLDPFGTLLITTDEGKTITELKNVNLKITQSDEKVFPLIKMPSTFTLDASPSINPLYLVSQSLLYESQLRLNGDVRVTHACDKLWKFPTYLGMKVGYCTYTGSLSWTDDDGDHEISLNGVGVSWSMRALL